MKNRAGINMENVKVNNRVAILNLLRKKGAMSRKDIAENINLTPAAVTILTNEMKLENILKETGELEEDIRAGRKKILIDINYDYKYVIGVNIDADYVDICISNIKLDIVASKRFTTDKKVLPEELIKTIAGECLSMLWKASIARTSIIGIGVGIIGLVDRENGISKHAFGLWHQEVNIKKILEAELGIDVWVDNNVRTLAIGEIDFGIANDVTNMIFVKYGPGIGSTILINSNIHYGYEDRAGEIGHFIIDVNGEKCSCGKRGCLETIASPKAILKKIRNEFSPEKTPKLYELCNGDIQCIDEKTIDYSIGLGDEAVTKIINNALEYLALSISNAIEFINPQRVVLYGSYFDNKHFYDMFIKKFNYVTEEKFNKNIILLSATINKGNYVGALALALRESFFNKGGID